MTAVGEPGAGDASPTHERGDPDAASGLLFQWLGLLLAPAIFFAHLQTAYLVVPWACRHDGELWLHVLGALAVVMTGAGVLFAWRAFDRAGRRSPGDGGGPVPRARLLAICGFALSSMLALIITLQWVAGFVISPCQ